VRLLGASSREAFGSAGAPALLGNTGLSLALRRLPSAAAPLTIMCVGFWGKGDGGGGGGRYGGGGGGGGGGETRPASYPAHPGVVRRLCEQLNDFRLDSAATQLTFPAALTAAERLAVHEECRRFNLASMSVGSDEHRQLTVYKSPEDMPSLPPGAWQSGRLRFKWVKY